MNRKFERISLGGVHDEADIRGHRKTYIGAYPGRVIQAIKNCGSTNPVIMLDEIDKVTSDHRGDPSAALLEVLDPAQNKNFADHYLGAPFDLSDVFFIANANNLSTIPAPLKDRLEIIHISGYSEQEKLIIANQYIVPRQIEESGLDFANIEFDNQCLSTVINNYTRESGLRGLEKQIASVCRKIARQYAEGKFDSSNLMKQLTPEIIQSHLGIKKFGEDFFHKESTAGVSLGLAYTSFGGEVLAIEANLIPTGKSKLVLTGQLGDVMKESAQAAYSYLKARHAEFGIDRNILLSNELHIHVPAGAIPKDGPSAGIALCSAMVSILKNQAPKSDTAMTGEITLLGKVLPIGGVKEKVLAAHREGLKRVILPHQNKADWLELEAHSTKNLEAHFVKDYSDVFALLFEDESSHLNIDATQNILKDVLAS